MQGYWLRDSRRARGLRAHPDIVLRDLAGNAFTSTIIMAIFMCITVELCPVRSQSSGSATDLDAVMALMAA